MMPTEPGTGVGEGSDVIGGEPRSISGVGVSSFIVGEGDMNLSTSGERLRFALQGADRIRIQSRSSALTAWTTAVLTVEVSNDGLVWAGLSPAVTITAEGLSSATDVAGVKYVSLRVSTTQGTIPTSTVRASITVYAYKNAA
jgi:hypothetical protein